jgi:hypothetical protein
VNEFQIGVLAGLVSGLLTSVITLVLGTYWTGSLRPWIEDLVYRGARIEGTWKCEVVVRGEKRHQLVLIRQRAHRIQGTITYAEDTLGCSHTYAVHGHFFNNVLTALAEEMGKARVDRGALMLVLQSGYAEVVMKGLGVWLEGNQPVTLEYRWSQEQETGFAGTV